ncbi:Pre-rRNA-processing protein TSR2-domain-containing protein [Acrodontium crateriforme]|uniref:Pre-rRNA-processing protein TSR2-domain-containing protein n=1 Tax=Acrodontium crateriforme TaxID=150365 RepID=A0AAQ3RDB2_9PEZI|nr:Pre-rRNA-processing protein TSR2-domain-containing protein [Acrodontium crateriforme]
MANAQLTPEQLSDALDHGIWYAISLWPALNIACANNWGGPNTSDKRDWFAGAVSELLTTEPDTDSEDLEVFLLQVMEDEFDLRVEDETECEVARNILLLRQALIEGDLEFGKSLEQRWKNRGQLKTDIVVADQTDREVEGDIDEDDEDVEMDEAPTLVPAAPREKPQPEIDEDGFERVISKKKR